MSQHINLTPTWAAILPTWLMLYEQAVTGDCTNPDLIKANARAELRRMAEAADNFNALARQLQEEHDYSKEKLEVALVRGRELIAASQEEPAAIKEGFDLSDDERIGWEG